MTRPIPWRAGRDGIGHAYPSARSTACGLPRLGERWAWPIEVRCPDCLAAIAKATR